MEDIATWFNMTFSTLGLGVFIIDMLPRLFNPNFDWISIFCKKSTLKNDVLKDLNDLSIIHHIFPPEHISHNSSLFKMSGLRRIRYNNLVKWHHIRYADLIQQFNLHFALGNINYQPHAFYNYRYRSNLLLTEKELNLKQLILQLSNEYNLNTNEMYRYQLLIFYEIDFFFMKMNHILHESYIMANTSLPPVDYDSPQTKPFLFSSEKLPQSYEIIKKVPRDCSQIPAFEN